MRSGVTPARPPLSMSWPDWRRRRQRVLAAILMVATAGGFAYAAHVPILTWLGHQLVHEDDLEPSDALLVLAGGVFDRELEAADLYTAGLAPRVLMTAEPDPDVFTELRRRHVRVESSIERRRRILIELGVPEGRITVLPGLVAATVHEAEAARQWADQAQPRSLIVVTSSFHTARSRFIFNDVFAGRPVTLRFAAARASDFQPDTWWQRRNTLRDGIFELQRTLFYRLRY
jgi:uncharacterized SAM-binding protein YcdF (DUF218 family)